MTGTVRRRRCRTSSSYCSYRALGHVAADSGSECTGLQQANTSFSSSFHEQSYTTAAAVLHHGCSGLTSRLKQSYITVEAVLHHGCSSFTSRLKQSYTTAAANFVCHVAYSKLRARYKSRSYPHISVSPPWMMSVRTPCSHTLSGRRCPGNRNAPGMYVLLTQNQLF